MSRSRAAHRGRFSTFELLLLGLLSSLIVVANVALHLPLKLPGHSGIVWMALLVIARIIVARPGAEATAGAFSGGLAALLGVGDLGALVTFLSYASAGVGVEIAARLLPRRGALGCAAMGAAGNLAKLGTKLAIHLALDVPAGFVLLGAALPAATHLAFGLAGGFLGHLAIVALRRAGFFASIAEKR